MIIKEEILRIRELMMLTEAPPSGGLNTAAENFGKFLATNILRLSKNFDDEAISKLFQKNQDKILSVIKKIRDLGPTDSISELSKSELKLLTDSVRTEYFAEKVFEKDFKMHQSSINKFVNDWVALSPDELKKEYDKMQKNVWDFFVNRGMGTIPQSQEASEIVRNFWEYYYQNYMTLFKNMMESKRPGFKNVIKPVTDYQDFINSRTWENITPLSDKEINALAKKNKGFFTSLNKQTQSTQDFFESRIALVDELMSLIKSLEGPIRNPNSVKRRISDLMLKLQQDEKEFFELMDRWIDSNIVGNPTFKGQIKELPGYIKAKKLSSGETVQELDKLYGTFSERAKKLRGEYRGLLFKWGENFKKKYESDVSKLETILSSPKFKELRNSYLFGSTLSPSDWFAISKELGIPKTLGKYTAEFALQYLIWSAVKSIFETLYDATINGLYVLNPTSEFIQTLAFDNEGKPVWTKNELVIGDESNDWLIILSNYLSNFQNQLTSWNGVIPGLLDDTIVGVKNLITFISEGGNLSPEKRAKIEETIRRGFDRAQQEVENTQRQQDSTTTSPRRILIPNDLESLFPQEIVKNIKRKFSTNNYVIKFNEKEYPIQFFYNYNDKNYPMLKDEETGKWFINIPERSIDFYPLSDTSTIKALVAAEQR